MGVAWSAPWFLAPTMWQIKRSKGTSGNPSKAYNNSVHDQHPLYRGGQHTLASFTKGVMPEVQAIWLREGLFKRRLIT